MKTNYENEKMNQVKSYEEASLIALDIIGKMNHPIGQVCGPITSGGKGSVEENLKVFEKTIDKLVYSGKNIFNQLSFEETLHRIGRLDEKKSFYEKNMDLLENFYGKIFDSGLVQNFYFIYGWESSFGTNWEHKRIEKLGHNKIYLPSNFLEQ